MWDIAAIGEPIIDFEQMNSTGQLEFRANAGGGSLNVLAAATAQGSRTTMLGCVGNDMFGSYLLSFMRERGIDTSGIKRCREKNTGIGFVSLGNAGEREFVFYRDSTSPITYYRAEDASILQNTKILHYTSVSLAGEPGRVSTREAVDAAAALQIPLSFDVNYRPAMWEGEQLAKEVIFQEVRRASIIKMDDKEALFITDETDVERAAQAVLSMGPRLVCITLGKDGSYYACPGGSGYCATITVQAVDTTGCGDAFVGVLLHELLKGRSHLDFDGLHDGQMRHMIQRANIAGALCSLKKGAAACMPSAREIERAIADMA